MVSEKISLARGATYVASVNVVIGISGVLYLAFATRLLPTVSDFGTVSIMALVLALLQSIIPLGLPSAIAKFLPELVGKYGLATAKGVSIKGFKIGIILSISGSLLCFLFAPQLSGLFFGTSLGGAVYFRLIAIDSFVVNLAMFVSQNLTGLKKFKEYSIINGITNVGRTIGSIFFLLIGLGITGIIFAWILFDILGLLLTVFACRDMIFGRAPDFPLGTMIKYSTPLYGSNILVFLQSTIDKYVVFGLAGSAALGLYTPAIAAVTYILVVPNSIVGVTFPKMCEAYGRGCFDEISRLSYLLSKYVSVVYVPLALGLSSVAFPMIELFAGSRYSAGAPTLAIVSAVSALVCFGAILNIVIMSINKTSILFASNFLSIISGAIVSFLLVPYLGATGAGIGRTSLLIVQFLVPLIYLCRIKNCRLNWNILLKSLVASLVMAFGVLVVESLVASKYLLPLYLIVGAAIYLIMVRSLKMLNKEDTTFFIAYLPARFRRIGTLLERFLLGSKINT
jgi:O-antigen/teichoic acid export membrane protein